MAILEPAYEELRLDYDEKCNELQELKSELRATKIEADELRLRLKAAGVGNSAPVPAALHVSPGAGASRPDCAEMCRLLRWLAEHVELSTPVWFDAHFEVISSGRRMLFAHIAQWRLKVAGNLKVSVPAQFEYQIGSLLAAAQARGNVLDEGMAQAFAEAWCFVASEAVPLRGSQPEPAIVLAHRETNLGILVATWPNPEVRRFILEDPFQEDDIGVHFRRSMNIEDKADEDSYILWGSIVDGIIAGPGWVRVGRLFLPTEIDGQQVLREVQVEPVVATAGLGQAPTACDAGATSLAMASVKKVHPDLRLVCPSHRPGHARSKSAM